jgi:hypothetical protein
VLAAASFGGGQQAAEPGAPPATPLPILAPRDEPLKICQLHVVDDFEQRVTALKARFPELAALPGNRHEAGLGTSYELDEEGTWMVPHYRGGGYHVGPGLVRIVALPADASLQHEYPLRMVLSGPAVAPAHQGASIAVTCRTTNPELGAALLAIGRDILAPMAERNGFELLDPLADSSTSGAGEPRSEAETEQIMTAINLLAGLRHDVEWYPEGAGRALTGFDLNRDRAPDAVLLGRVPGQLRYAVGVVLGGHGAGRRATVVAEVDHRTLCWPLEFGWATPKLSWGRPFLPPALCPPDVVDPAKEWSDECRTLAAELEQDEERGFRSFSLYIGECDKLHFYWDADAGTIGRWRL